MKIHIFLQNDTIINNFTKNNPTISNLVFYKEDSSILSVIERVIEGEDDFALFVKDDVFLPSSINKNVSELIETLNQEWPNWGICGNTGIATVRLTGNARTCSYLFDLNGGPTLQGAILPAETINQTVILINCKALRSTGFKLPAFEGAQFYDLILSLETLDAGLSVLIAPQLACFQLSKPSNSEFSEVKTPLSLLEYLSNKVSNRFIKTIEGLIKIPFKGKKSGQFDIFNRAMINASAGRKNASIAFVIRTQFRNVDMLKRAIVSTFAFSAATQNKYINTYVITDKDLGIHLDEYDGKIKIISLTGLPNVDTRNILLREAIHSVKEDFVLFLDDDDWLFPNEAQAVSLLLACLPKQANLVVDSQAFSERITLLGETDWRNSSLKMQKKFSSSAWAFNFSGHNNIPVCGAFYSRQILMDQPMATFDTVTYFEDFTMSIYALLNPNSMFFSTPKTITGISIRDIGNGVENTVNVSDRTKWSQSQAELAYHLCLKPKNNVAFSVGRAFASSSINLRADKNFEHNNLSLTRFDRKILVISRTLRGFILFAIRPKHYKINAQRYLVGLRQHGVRGLVRAIVETK